MPGSAYEAEKKAIDASLPGSITISAETSADVQADTFGEAFSGLVRRLQTEDNILLAPLRYVLLTAELGKTVKRWEQTLRRPEVGVSEQPEGVAAAKTISWGRDKESPRSLIILADSVAAGIIAGSSIAIAGLAHECGHVHDDFLRGTLLGFRESEMPPRLADWPGVCNSLAQICWSEYAAESVGARYLTGEDLLSFLANDVRHLAGIDHRVRESVLNYKREPISLGAVWSRSVTDFSDLLGNLGRAAARLPFADDYELALSRLAGPAGDTARWGPIVKRLVRELETLGSSYYSSWGTTPFTNLEEVVTQGFQAMGLFPAYDGTNLRVRIG